MSSLILAPNNQSKNKYTGNAHGVSFQATGSTLGCSYTRSELANDGTTACHLALIRCIVVLEIWDRMLLAELERHVNAVLVVAKCH